MRRDGGALADLLGGHERVLEVGIGGRTDLAAVLTEAGVAVVAIDVDRVDVPSDVRFVRADVRDVTPERLAPVDAVYARRLPPELHGPTAGLADALDAELVFTTLGGEAPSIPVEVHTGPHEAVYRRRDARSDRV